MSTTSQPPRFVPTLTDVVQHAQRDYPEQTDNATHPAAQAYTSAQTYPYNSAYPVDPAPPPSRSEELLVKRVMQQVDVVLERRLREALGRIILEQTEALAPKLRAEIEQVVKDSIALAVAQESLGR